MMVDGYKESIKYLAENRIDEVVYNSDEEHAVVVLSELIKNADDYVHIVCKNMDPTVTGKPEYLDAVKSFLRKKDSKELKILLTDYDNSFKESDIFNVLKNFPEKVLIKSLGNKFMITSDGSPINWTVADNRAFRLEKDIEKYIAFGNFNDKNLARKFNIYFERFFNNDRCTLISL